jgi:predicted metal-dependent phosphoesterase TrpH
MGYTRRFGFRSEVIDLHCHTTESDGTFSPAELIDTARRTGITTLAITDHDTFSGSDQAAPLARAAGIDLIPAIELSTKLHGHSAHLLGYFPTQDPSAAIRQWIAGLQESRRDRNVRLIARLQELGLDITLEEVQARGRTMTGRPHFAQILVEKGYVANMQQAFDDYLDESAKGYVDRYEPELSEAVGQIRAGGGLASLAHPIRVKGDVAALLPDLCGNGLDAIEAYHSDHTPELTAAYLELAERHHLRVTGGSDFHGANKPQIQLGTGRDGNLNIPVDLVDRLRA